MKTLLLFLLLFTTISLSQKGKSMNNFEKATLGAGCFWCVEAVFERLDGVTDVSAGYAGGTLKNPSYQEVCSGKTGHAEVAQITFDTKKISFEKILEVFWDAHDPTTMNKQGADEGTQYRSVIFYENALQKSAAEKSIALAQKHFESTIVTAIEPLTNFYKAENYHQDYFRNNNEAPYCRFVIKPKVEKLQKKGIIK